MLCTLLSHKHGKQLLAFQAQPVCAVDYCVHCGKCLMCDAAEPCPGHNDHRWVICIGDVIKFLNQRHQVPAVMGLAS